MSREIRMSHDIDVLPELKEIVGSLLFAAEPLNLKQLQAMIDTGTVLKGPFEQYAKVDEEQVESAIEELQQDLERQKLGLEVAQLAGGWRLQNNVMCGPFVRSLLEKNQTVRLSKPALETLAIVAYRQPCHVRRLKKCVEFRWMRCYES